MSANPRDIPTMRMVVGSTSERYTIEGDISFGLIRYNTTDNNVEAYAKGGWVNLQGGGSGGGVGTDASLSSIVEYTDNSGITFLSDVSVNGVLNSTDGSFSGNLYSASGIIGGASGWILGANGQNYYTFTGSGLDGSESNPTLNLFRGNKYIFINNNNIGAHPFQIYNSDDSLYGTGVTNNGGAGGSTITFEVPHDAPKTLKYRCTSHSGAMNGIINIHGGGSAVDASFQSDVTVAGNLYVDGSFNFSEVIQNITTVNNELLISTQVDISNLGTGPALSVTQHGDGAGDNLVLLHAGTDGSAVEVKGDGKSIFYKDVDISGRLVLLDDISINGDLIYGGFADISSKVFLNTVTTTFNTGTIVDLSDVVTAMSTKFTTHDASFENDVDISGKLVVNGDLHTGFHREETLLAGGGSPLNALHADGFAQGGPIVSRLAFNGSLADSNDSWLATGAALSISSLKFLDFEFPYDVIITKYKIWPRNGGTQYNPEAWTLRGYNGRREGYISEYTGEVGTWFGSSIAIDAGPSNYDIIDTRTSETDWDTTSTSSITDDTDFNVYYLPSANTNNSHRLFRFAFSAAANYSAAAGQPNITVGEVAFYGYRRRGRLNVMDASFENDVEIAGKLVVKDDVLFNVDVSFNGELNMGFNQKELLLAGAGGLDGTGSAQGTATASSYFSNTGYDAPAAFNNSHTEFDSWHSIVGTNGGGNPQGMAQFIVFEFPYDVIVTKYKIWPRFGGGKNPKTWKLQGSIEFGGTYTESSVHKTIDEETNVTGWQSTDANSITNNTEMKEFSVDSSSNAYRTFRLLVSASEHADYVTIGELAFYGYRKGTINARHLVVNGGAYFENDVDISGKLVVKDHVSFNIICNGKIGIGTTTPHCPLSIYGESGAMSSAPYRMFNYNSFFTSGNATWTPMGMYCEKPMLCGSWVVSQSGTLGASDKRIKKDIRDIPKGEAVSLMRKLKPRKYKYIDKRNERYEVAGFIADEVKEILPEGVKLFRQQVPNIFQFADLNDDILSFGDDYNVEKLSVDKPIQLMTKNDLPVEVNILKIDTSNNNIQIDINNTNDNLKDYTGNTSDTDNNKIFVYGEVVEDFKALKHEYLNTIMFQSVKEIDMEQQADKIKIKSLEDRLAILEAKINNM